jgi:uncharacterized repeat protein (TIGR03803 family)
LGGANNLGVVFKIAPAGKLTVLYSFDGTNGGEPLGPLVQGSDGNFYGTTASGGSGTGVVFKVTPTGALTVLHPLNGTTHGGLPESGVVQATDGNFYGVSTSGGMSTNCNGCGTIFRVTATGNYQVLYDFDNITGASPFDLLQHTNGLLYGGTYSGGTDSDKRKVGQELKVQRIFRFGMNDAKYLAGNTVNSYEEYC